MKVYLDSCIVINLVEGEKSARESITAALAEGHADIIAVSDLVRMECRVGPLRSKDARALARLDDFFGSAFVIPLDSKVFDLAAGLRAEHRLKTPDAIHAAAAITDGCDEFWTNDERLKPLGALLKLRSLP